MPVNGSYLDPAGDEVVRGSEYELLGTGGLRGSQDHLPSSSSIGAGQDELLLGGSGGVHRGDDLDLLSRLLVGHDLQDITRRGLSRGTGSSCQHQPGVSWSRMGSPVLETEQTTGSFPESTFHKTMSFQGVIIPTAFTITMLFRMRGREIA